MLTTCPRPKKGLIFPRDYYLRAAMASDTAVLAAGMSQWCIINFLTRKLERNDIDFQGQCIEQAPFEEGIEKIRCSAPQDTGSHLVTEDDLDVNRHVLSGSPYSRLIMNFSKEARLGDEIFLFKEEQEGGTAVMGKLEDGSTVFQAFVG